MNACLVYTNYVPYIFICTFHITRFIIMCHIYVHFSLLFFLFLFSSANLCIKHNVLTVAIHTHSLNSQKKYRKKALETYLFYFILFCFRIRNLFELCHSISVLIHSGFFCCCCCFFYIFLSRI